MWLQTGAHVNRNSTDGRKLLLVILACYCMSLQTIDDTFGLTPRPPSTIEITYIFRTPPRWSTRAIKTQRLVPAFTRLKLDAINGRGALPSPAKSEPVDQPTPDPEHYRNILSAEADAYNAIQQNAVAHSVQFAILGIRTLMIAHGGAIVALLSQIGSFAQAPQG